MKLKDTHTLRIFISSPFNGMELERETLSKLYWPKIKTILSTRGIQLRTVDMRWGITSEESSENQTINICLREIDRSDLFVGFFGQRYGWHGINDKALQEDFDKAQDRYPWINKFRDRSVTEIEFLHGHLNHPGQLPAIICFRNKEYDDVKRSEGQVEGNQRTIRKFSAESEHSIERMNDLKRRIKESEAETLGIDMSYSIPEKCAEFIYNHLWERIKKHVFNKIPEKMSEKEISKMNHRAIFTNLCSLYVGGQRFYPTLDAIVESTDSRFLAIVSEGGCGKSALICNWIQERWNKDDNIKICYHFVGADQNTNPSYVVSLITEGIYNDFLNMPYTKPKASELETIQNDFQTCVAMVQEKHPKATIVLVVDAVELLEAKERTSNPMFWITHPLPEHLRIIATVSSSDEGNKERLNDLKALHGAQVLNIDPLTYICKKTICEGLLKENSKSLSSEQMDLILASDKAANPLFLTLLIDELCNSGAFRTLTAQIERLLSSEGVQGLFSKILDRVERDYNPKDYQGNMVQDILGAICISKHGLSESEIPVPSHCWTPLYFSLSKCFMLRQGVLGYSSADYVSVIKNKYLSDTESRERIYQFTIEIFQAEYREAIEERKSPRDRCVTELTHLLYSSGDINGIIKVLSSIDTFNSLYSEDPYLLYDYWQATEMQDDAIARRYLKSLDQKVVDNYTECLDTYEDPKRRDNFAWEANTLETMHQWFYNCKMYKGTQVLLERLIAFELRRSDLPLLTKEQQVVDVRYKLACLFCDTDRYSEAIVLHQQVLKDRERLYELGKMSKNDLGKSHHGLGACYLLLKDYDKAEESFLQALDLEKDDDDLLNRTDLLTNLSSVYKNKGNFEKARDTLLECIKVREQKEVGRISLDMAYLYNNLGLIYRAMEDYDKTEEYYLKSLKLKEKILGRRSLDAAFSLMNLGTLEGIRNDLQKSIEYNLEALDIYKTTIPDSAKTIMAEENVALSYVKMEKYQEAEPYSWNAYKALMKCETKMANCIPSLHREMVNFYAREDNWQTAGEITVALIESGLGNDRDYGLLDMADNNLPVRPKRPTHLTLDAGLLKWPESPLLLNFKLKHLIPSGIEAIMEFAQKHCANQNVGEEKGKRYIVTGATLATTYQLIPEALSVLSAGKKYAPDNKALDDLIEEVQGFQNVDQDGASEQNES